MIRRTALGGGPLRACLLAKSQFWPHRPEASEGSLGDLACHPRRGDRSPGRIACTRISAGSGHAQAKAAKEAAEMAATAALQAVREQADRAAAGAHAAALRDQQAGAITDCSAQPVSSRAPWTGCIQSRTTLLSTAPATISCTTGELWSSSPLTRSRPGVCRGRPGGGWLPSWASSTSPWAQASTISATSLGMIDSESPALDPYSREPHVGTSCRIVSPRGRTQPSRASRTAPAACLVPGALR